MQWLTASPHGTGLGTKKESGLQIGFEIAPVPLNLENKSHDLVGLGSYIVNAQAACNDCHSSVTSTGPTDYVFGGNPYFGQRPTKVNPATYLGGGMDFGNLGAGSDIISRNLTPTKPGGRRGATRSQSFLRSSGPVWTSIIFIRTPVLPP